MKELPDFIVDRKGRVRDVRAKKKQKPVKLERIHQAESSNHNKPPRFSRAQDYRQVFNDVPRFIVIPVGLILTILIAVFRSVVISSSSSSSSTQSIYSPSSFEFNYINQGHRAYLSGNYDEALEYANLMLAIDRNPCEAHNLRGLVFFALGEFDDSFFEFDQAVTLKPSEPGYHNNRGATYMQLGNYELAFADYKIAIELDPSYAKAYFNRGVAFMQQGEFEVAIKEIDLAIEYSYEFWQTHLEMLRSSGYDESGDRIEEELFNSPYVNLGDAYYIRSLVHLYNGDLEQANADFAEAESYGFKLEAFEYDLESDFILERTPVY